MDEKAPLPAIIVTPSSPSHETDFAIAFIAPPPTPTLYDRVVARLPKLPSFRPRLPSQIQLPPTPFKNSFEESSSWSIKSRARTTIVFTVLLFIMACHLVLHQVVVGHPHLQFGMGPDNDMVALNSLVPPTARFGETPDATPNDSSATSAPSSNWFDLFSIWAPTGGPTEGKRGARFIISESEEDLT